MSASRVVRRASLTVGLLLVATSVFAQATATQKPFEPTVGQQGKDVVWVPTPQSLVDKMLDIAKLTPQDYLMDLGSGDGRTVITAAKRGARAKGIEYNPDMVALSQKNAAAAKIPLDRASFEKADLFETDFSQATVITMFLLP
ncbi:MAG TPA: methyltransferase domain-containing protein, partial [Vicinamibacterales bacterium]